MTERVDTNRKCNDLGCHGSDCLGCPCNCHEKRIIDKCDHQYTVELDCGCIDCLDCDKRERLCWRHS